MTDKQVIIVQDSKEAVINTTRLEVVTVGTQGPAGPSLIGGKPIPGELNPPTDDALLQYDETQDAWVYTKEIDAGTY
jgi:hypothetical protein